MEVGDGRTGHGAMGIAAMSRARWFAAACAGLMTGCSSVGPLTGAAAGVMRIGDRVWLRHTKSGELSEHVDGFHLVDGVDGRARVVGEVASYRGDGKVFL